MKRWQQLTVSGVLVLATLIALTPAGAFVLSPGTPSENVSAAGTRAPGLMVNGGVSRHLDRLDDFRSPNDITETSPPDGLVDLFLPQWIDIIFGQINTSLDLLITALFLRAGETPPALNQLSGTTIPPSKVKDTSRSSLVDRSMERVGLAGH